MENQKTKTEALVNVVLLECLEFQTKLKKNSGTSNVEYEDKQERKWGEQDVKFHAEFINQNKFWTGRLGDIVSPENQKTYS